jgi:hypothetical protein
MGAVEFDNNDQASEARRRGTETAMKMKCRGERIVRRLLIGFAGLALLQSLSAAPRRASCRKIVLTGEVSAGLEWKAAFGEGWIFRVLPIQPGHAGYSGWDLVVDREQPAGFPDALLLASPPYNSINEREVGTTFGLRAQDAIGWNPRSFHFLTNVAALREGQQLFRSISQLQSGLSGGAGPLHPDEALAAQRLMVLEAESSPGEFRILDARLTPGIADAAAYAQNWALASAKTTHTNEAASGGGSTPLGQLHWMRFSIALWLPESWKAPPEIHASRAACSK